MAALLVLMIFWSVWTFNLGQCGVATVKPEMTESSSISDMSDTQFIFSHHFRKIIEGIYKNSFKHFDEIVHFSEISDDVNFKADVLSGLYDAMSNAHHTEIPYHAIELYNKIEEFLNVSTTNLYPEKLNELLSIREGLLLSSIVPKASHVLESAAYVKSCSLYGTPVDKLLKILLKTNETVSNLTFNEIVAKVRWTLPVEELTPILADLSPYLKQNVDILLAFYDIGQFQEAEEEIITKKLFQLTKNLDYAKMITPEKQRKIDAIIPSNVKIQYLFSGRVCFYQELSNGNRRYIHRCWNTYELCIYEYSDKEPYAVFVAEMKQKPSVYSFRDTYFDSQSALAIRFDGDDERLYFNRLNESVDFYWKVQLEGQQVMLQNMNSTNFLCTDGSNNYMQNHGSLLLDDYECKWIVEDCN